MRRSEARSSRYASYQGMTQNPFKANPRTFVVDDEEEIAKMLAVILQMNLFDAIPFIDPEGALAAAREEAPEYLITDVVMPGMNGIDLAIAIRGLAPECKVLLFSGQVGAGELIAAANAAGHNFTMVEKPIHPRVLTEALLQL